MQTSEPCYQSIKATNSFIVCRCCWSLGRTASRKFSIGGVAFLRGALHLCGGTRHSKNWLKLHWFIVFHVSIRGDWSFFGGTKLGLPYQMRRNSWQIYVSHCNQFVRRKHFYCDLNSGCIESTLLFFNFTFNFFLTFFNFVFN